MYKNATSLGVNIGGLSGRRTYEDLTILGVDLRALFGSPIFQVGLACRLALLVVASPWIWTNWFVPFVDFFLTTPSIDPWSGFIQSTGDRQSYPYGPVMLIINAATVGLGNILGWMTGWQAAANFGFGLSILAADLLMLVVLCNLGRGPYWQTLLLYWLSPLTIYIAYFHGQVDMVPLALLMLSLALLKRRMAIAAGVCIGLSVAAKLSFVLALPLPLIFLWRSKRHRKMLIPFGLAMSGVILFLQVPYLFSAGVAEMTLRNPNAETLYRLAIEIAPGYPIFVAPLAYGLFLYTVWRLERLSFELLIAGTGIAFLIIVLLTPATLGWYMWVVPFLALHQQSFGRRGVILVTAFSLSIIVLHVFVSTGAILPLFGWDGLAVSAAGQESHGRLLPLLATAIAAIGAVLGIQMYREGIRNNDFFRLSRQPLTVGIAGDSGSGKDTLSGALAELFGDHSVVAVSGDDYHMWDRFAPMWASLTHLNPQANDLAGLARDVADLRRGRAVYCRRYDHDTGRFSASSPIKANDCILVSGLHTLFFSGLTNQLDTRIFLDMDEDLRRHLKLRRDMTERGHDINAILEALNQRQSDSQKFIRPQISQADIVFSLRAESREQLESIDNETSPKLALHVVLSYGIFYQELARVLIGVCGLRLDTQVLGENGAVEFSIEGDVADGDIELAAQMLLPDINDLLDISPQWRGGMNGVMQLISLVQIAETLRNRSEMQGAA